MSGMHVGDGLIEFSVEPDKPAWLLVSQAWYPHWRAYFNGSPVPLARDAEANVILVRVPSGSGTLVLRFEDPYQGLWGLEPLALAGLLAGLALYAASGRRGPGGMPAARGSQGGFYGRGRPWGTRLSS
ncbi:hypothetical protein [Pyrodictium occultum]|uniref:hypothetical protein n=1 Tax=Pyrodictium occultum TaxID=2309 RepID=UPI0014434729|nr:hypothetical protein [Pyrodictium occultum]